jgi:predicted O-linked N-acetylglucosamine transferase (SPINDLY family)/TolA-binding protein
MKPAISAADEMKLRDAMSRFESGDLEGAERAARELLERLPGNPDARHLLVLSRLHRGAAQEALGLAEDLVRDLPDDAFAHNTLGACLQALGRSEEAARAFRSALDRDPLVADAAGNLGMALLGLRRPEEALALAREFVPRLPQFLPMPLIGGHAAIATGRLDEAAAFFARALEMAPGHPRVLDLLGDAQSRVGRHAEALRTFDELLAREPGNAGASNNRGNALLALGRALEAEAAFRAAIALNPSIAPPWHNLGCALLELGRPAECEEAERKALSIDPAYSEAQVTLSAALNRMNRGAEAEAVARQVIARAPGNLRAIVNLCGSLSLQKRHDEALATAVDAASRFDGEPDAQGVAACLLAQGGRHREAVARFDAAIRLAPSVVHWQVLRALAMPIIAESVDELLACREEAMRRIAGLRDSGLRLDDPARWIGQTGFYLAYQGEENLEIQRATAEMYLRLHPQLGWRAPSATARDRRGRRLRVGFLSAFLHNHTIGKLYRGLLKELDRVRFEVVVFHAEPRGDEIRREIDAAADRVVLLPTQLEQARKAVSDAALDILFYPDVGMHNLCYFLSFARLAPVQVTSWGHPDTTGLPDMDYFVSSDLLEPAGAEAQYSERLVRLGRLPCYYRRPRLPPKVGVRRQLGVPGGARLYACPQSLFKFHPEFDPTLGALLEADPNGVLLLVASEHAAWTATLKNRLQRVIGARAERVMFAPIMPEGVFLELLLEADAIIDPVHFGGGNSTYEALGVGAPIVTLPGRFMRGRVTLGCYRQMGFEDLVASSPAEYVALAVRLANDRDFREAMRAQVRERAEVLFNDELAVRELEAFMEKAFDEAVAKGGAE